MKKIVVFVFAVGLMLFASSDLKAQRLIPGQNVISVSVTPYMERGGRIAWGRCSHVGKSVFSFNFLNTADEIIKLHIKENEFEDEERIDYVSFGNTDLSVSGGYLWRLVGTRNRVFNIWGGITFDMGTRLHDEKYPAYQVPKVKFIYGFTPKLEVEVFPSKGFSIYGYAYPHLQLYGHRHQEEIFYPEFGLGLNFYFF